jgi:hypothetical protein
VLQIKKPEAQALISVNPQVKSIGRFCHRLMFASFPPVIIERSQQPRNISFRDPPDNLILLSNLCLGFIGTHACRDIPMIFSDPSDQHLRPLTITMSREYLIA